MNKDNLCKPLRHKHFVGGVILNPHRNCVYNIYWHQKANTECISASSYSKRCFANSQHDTKKEKSSTLHQKVAFTLAEVIVVLTLLGIIATITIPNAINSSITKADKVKLKKAMAVYDQALNEMVIVNGLKSNTDLANFGYVKPILSRRKNDVDPTDSTKYGCVNTRAYFKPIQAGINNCIFKTADGIWWDITNIQNPIISLDKNGFGEEKRYIYSSITAQDKSNKKIFGMIGHFDEQGSLIINNMTNENNNDDNVAYLQKINNFLNNVDIKSAKLSSNNVTPKKENNWQLGMKCMNNGHCSKYDYDSKGNMTVRYDCDDKGENCSPLYKWTYDDNNNKTAQYSCNTSTNICALTNKYEYGNNTMIEYYNCSGNECSNYHKYEYDENNNIIGEYKYCGVGGCSFAYKHIYDKNNNMIESDYSCGGDGTNCHHADYFEYDSNNNKILSYGKYCTWGLENCPEEDDEDDYDYSDNYNYVKYTYDSNNNITGEYKCDDYSGCIQQYKYTYDSNGNLTSKNGCHDHGYGWFECIYDIREEYTYDSNNNMTSKKYLNYNCAWNKDCWITETYSYYEK